MRKALCENVHRLPRDGKDLGGAILSWVIALCVVGVLHSMPIAAQTLANLDALYRRVIELEQASKYAEAVVLAELYADGTAAQHGVDSSEHAVALNQLARMLQATNRIAEAEPLFRPRACHCREQGGVRPSRRRCDSQQPGSSDNRLTEAEVLYRRALAIDEKSLGPEHPSTAIDLNNLAQLLQASNRTAEAEPLLRRALVITERSLGPEHPSVATRLTNLGLLLAHGNRSGEAEQLMRRALV